MSRRSCQAFHCLMSILEIGDALQLCYAMLCWDKNYVRTQHHHNARHAREFTIPSVSSRLNGRQYNIPTRLYSSVFHETFQAYVENV